MINLGKRPSARIAEKGVAEQNAANKKDVERLMAVFATRQEKLGVSVKVLQVKGVDVQFRDYLDFQNLTSELLTFLIIIDRKLQDLDQGSRGELIDRFDDLVIAIWSILLRGALSFFVVISEDQYLPLGSREVFTRELRTLNEAQVKLSASPYKEKVPDDVNRKLEMAERILVEVIEKAPSLLEL